MYRVVFSEIAKKQFKKLDKSVSALLFAWINKNLEGCSNPRIHGKCLVANQAGKWRYRVGDYRILANILDDQVVILIVNIGHRSEIYK